MVKKYYGVAVDGLIIRATSKEEAEKIVSNKFSPSQLQLGCVYYDGTTYDADKILEMKHLSHLHYPACINDPEIPCIR
jgi:hypothetical protein|tara:strand:- start:1195 stop:1428 length:234 start_codon:yes stop_codon:yes gene_type:complete